MAKKYIDAELLRKKIEKWKSLFSKEKENKDASKTDKLSLGGRIAMLEEILVLIDSLQQEQPCDTCTNDKGCVTCKDGDMNSIKGWVARDKANDLYFFTYKPHRTDGVFHSEISEDILHLSNDMFPELSWETEPIEVELLPKKLM